MSGLFFCQSQKVNGQRKRWIDLHCFLQLLDCRFIAASKVKDPSFMGVDHLGERIKFQSAVDFGNGLFEAGGFSKKQRVPLMAGGVVGIELEGAEVFDL